jgi:hypothetical protein
MTPSALRYRLQWNNRFNTGDSSQEYLFHYLPAHSTPIDPVAASPAAPHASDIQGAN